MGLMLNGRNGINNYLEAKDEVFFVDKSLLLPKLIQKFSTRGKYICVTRPRRFGKSTNAQMMAAFFGKQPCPELFEDLQIASHPDFAQHLNQHNVVFLTMKDQGAASYQEFISLLQDDLLEDLKVAYPKCNFDGRGNISRAFTQVERHYPGEKFIFIIDEWDDVFNFSFLKNDLEAGMQYQNWLRDLLKDQPYVEFAYLTGIRPLATVSPGSSLNMFQNFTLLNDNTFREDFGFTQQEVDQLFNKFVKIQADSGQEAKVSLADLEFWYDGYDTTNGVKLYNPRSVCLALQNNAVSNYWTGTSVADEIFLQIQDNAPLVADDIKNLVADLEVEIADYEYSAITGTPETRDEILSAMVAYGFLTFKDGKLRIPNHELRLRFVRMLRKHQEFGVTNKIIASSKELLAAISSGDAAAVAERIEFIHEHLAPQERFNSEAEFASVFRFGFMGLLEFGYTWQIEVKAGTGKADMVLLPKQKTDDLVIIELKVDATPEQAITQIKQRNYQHIADGLFYPEYTGRIIAVGVSYQRNTPDKQHCCAIELLREI